MTHSIGSSKLLIFFFIYTFVIFPFGPGVEGFWNTTGFRSIYPLFFEFIVTASFYRLISLSPKYDFRVVFRTQHLVASLLITIQICALNWLTLTRVLSGDEIVYVGMPKSTFDAIYQTSNKFNEVAFQELLRNQKFTSYCISIAFLSIVLIVYITLVKKSMKQKMQFTAVLIFVVVRNFIQIFSDFNYQYPVGFTLPLNLALTPEISGTILRFTWSLFVVWASILIVGQFDSGIEKQAMLYLAITIALLQDEVAKYLLTIEPITLTLLVGTTAIVANFRKGYPTSKVFGIIAVLSLIRPVALLWTIALLASSIKHQAIFIKRIKGKMRFPDEFRIYIPTLIPMLVHMAYQVVLRFYFSTDQKSGGEFRLRLQALLESFNESFAVIGFLTLGSFVSFVLLHRKWELLTALILIFSIYIFSIPYGAIDSNKYVVEFFVPIQIATLYFLLSFGIRAFRRYLVYDFKLLGRKPKNN